MRPLEFGLSWTDSDERCVRHEQRCTRRRDCGSHCFSEIRAVWCRPLGWINCDTTDITAASAPTSSLTAMAEFTGQVKEPTKKKRARVEEILVWEEDVSSDEHKQKGFTFATAAGCLGAGLLAASGYLSYQMNLRRHIKAELARKPATTPAGSPSLTLDLPAAEVERERLRILATSQTHMRKLARSLVLSAVLSTGTFAVACGLVAWAWDLKSVR